MPHISHDAKLKHLESMVLHVVGSGVTFVGAAYLLNSDLNIDEARKFAIAGMLSETVSQYVYENFLVEPVF